MLKELIHLSHQAFAGRKQKPDTQPLQINGNSPQALAQASAAASVSLATTEDFRSTDRNMKRLPLNHMRADLGQDIAVVQQKIRQILATQLPAMNTRSGAMEVQLDALGQIRIRSELPEGQRQALEETLNAHPDLRQRLQKLSDQTPTLEFLSNTRKLHEAYGSVNATARQLMQVSQQDSPSLQNLSRQLKQLQVQHPQGIEQQKSPGFAIGVALN